MAGPLDDLLPIRRLLVDGSAQPFVRDLEFDGNDFQIDVDANAGVQTIRIAHGGTVVAPSGDTTGAMVLDINRSYTASAYLGRVFVGVADSGHVLGATALVRIPASTIAAAADLEIASDLDPDGDVVGGLDVASDQTIAITCVDATGRGRFEASLVGGPKTTAAPMVVSAIVDGANPNAIVVTCSAPVHMPDITGLSMSFTSGTARTITAVEAVNADATAWTLTLSGNMAGDEVCSFVVGSTRTARALNGALLTAGSTSVTFSGYAYDWSGVANVSLWLEGDSGIGVADGAAMSSGWTGKNPPAAYVFSEATNRPTFRATGVNGEPSADFDGSNDLLTSASMTVTNMLGAASTAFCVVAAIAPDAAPSLSIGYDTPAIFSDPTGYVGMHICQNAGNYYLIGYVFDGATKYAYVNLGASLPARMIAHMRLSSGSLIVGVDGTEPASGGGTVNNVACGAVSASADALLVQLGKAATSRFFDGDIAGLVAIKSGSLPTAGIASWASKYV